MEGGAHLDGVDDGVAERVEPHRLACGQHETDMDKDRWLQYRASLTLGLISTLCLIRSCDVHPKQVNCPPMTRT